MKKYLAKENTDQRDVAIDAALGVALFLVCLSHAHHNPHYVTAFYIMAFFFISGWLYRPGRSYEQNIRKKASRVLLPYFANSLVLLIIYALSKHFTIEQVAGAIKGIIYSRNYIVYTGTEDPVMGNIANNPLWYLTSFFTTSLLFHAVVDSVTRNWKYFVLVCLSLLSLSIVMAQLPVLLPWSIDMIPFCTVVMLFGYMFKKSHFSLNLNGYVTALLFSCYIALCYENGSINLSIRNFGGEAVRKLNVS